MGAALANTVDPEVLVALRARAERAESELAELRRACTDLAKPIARGDALDPADGVALLRALGESIPNPDVVAGSADLRCAKCARPIGLHDSFVRDDGRVCERCY